MEKIRTLRKKICGDSLLIVGKGEEDVENFL